MLNRASGSKRMEWTKARGLGRSWWTGAVSVLSIGAMLRIFNLGLKPLHADEGVNGLFLLGLFREGIYRYNPANYHGPSLYYFALVSSSVSHLLFGNEGPSTLAIRAVPVAFGIALIGLLLTFRARLGDIGTLTAAGLVAFSPGMVYLSRDFIHETLLGFFTLWVVVWGLRFWDSKKLNHLFLISLAASLMICTKETAPISLFALTVAAGVAQVWVRRDRGLSAAEFGGWTRLAWLVVASVALFLTCSFLFFSSFLGNYPQGVRDAVTTYTYWTRTGMTQHGAPWHTYVVWLLREEAPIFILAAMGTVLAMVQRNSRLAVFAGIWALVLLAAYSVIPYKTPWILLNIIVPMSIVGGAGLQILRDYLVKHYSGRLTQFFPAALSVVALAICFYQSVQLSFFHYDDDRYLYPYVQTRRDFMNLVAEINEVAATRGGMQTRVAVLTPDYWPLPWYLRDYRKVAYFGKVTPTDFPIVVGSLSQMVELQHLLAGGYQLKGWYPLRPGVDLVLYVANETTP
jgi:uncharacterized protein (TIGR03663 family)